MGKNINIKELLQNYYFGNIINTINNYYSNSSVMEIFGIERLETAHSKFFNWLFNNSKAAIRNLLYLALKWSEKQNRPFDDTLKRNMYLGNVEIMAYKADKEVQTNTNEYGNGSVDVVITCTISLGAMNTQKRLNVILENKIYSPETKKKDKSGTILYQTNSYYQYYSDNYKDDINIFVFMKPVTTDELGKAQSKDLTNWCHSKKFIVVNYQEIVDYVLTPLLNSESLDERSQFLIKEYIKSLGKTTDNSKYSNKPILAMGEEEKSLLVSFYEKNRELIYAALKAVSESKDKMISEEDKEVAQAFANSEDEVRISGKRNKYNVFYPGNTNNQPLTMRDVVAEFVWFLLKTKKLSILDINNQIKNMVGKVASTTDIVKESDKQDKNSRYVIYERDGKSFYVHRDWTLKSGTPNLDFNSFKNNIVNNNDYSDFTIELLA